MKILITGSRDWTDAEELERALKKAIELDRAVMALQGRDGETVSFITGGAPGVDTLGKKIVERLGYSCHEEPAQWSVYGDAAGPLRNQKMIDMRPELVLAFPTLGSKGTWDTVSRAEAAEIEVLVWADGGWGRPRSRREE